MVLSGDANLADSSASSEAQLYLVGFASMDEQETVAEFLFSQGSQVLHYVPENHFLVSSTLQAVLLAEERLGISAVR